MKRVEDVSGEACDADGIYVILQIQRWGKGLKYCWTFTWEYAAFCYKMVGCLYDLFRTAAGWRGRLFHFCGAMNGNCRDLVGTVWEWNWTRGEGRVCGRWWVWIVLCWMHLRSLCMLCYKFLCNNLPISAFLYLYELRRKRSQYCSSRLFWPRNLPSHCFSGLRVFWPSGGWSK